MPLLMSEYLEDLNTDQKKAAMQIDGASMVIAGPGSGKTRVLTYRIAHLLKNEISAFNILALTFTNKAAKEMRNRIGKIVGESDSKNLWMGTFHSVFSRILRIESDKINFPKNFTIYDTIDSRSVIRSIIKDLKLDKDAYKPNEIQNRISLLKNNFITPEKYKFEDDLIISDTKSKRPDFSKIYQMYSNRCIKSAAMDFDDLLLNTYKILSEEPDVLNKYQKKFHYIMVDEYQDTNHIQYLIIKKLAALNENIFVVGDDAQSIYSFRGANIQNILNFKYDYPDYKLYKLEQNYRSTNKIVSAANSLIKHNKKQINKEVWTNNKEGEFISICETTTDNDEARLVSNTIDSLISNNNYYDCAILYRTNAQSRAIEEALRRINIPYKIYGGLSFYQRKEIKDILAYLRLSINHKDEEALKRIINYPARGIGDTTLQKLIITAEQKNCTIWEIIEQIEGIDIKINNGLVNKLVNFRTLIQSYSAETKSKDAYNITEHIIKSSGIYSTLSLDKSPEGTNRFENIQELLNGIKDFTENFETNTIPLLSDFMQEVALMTDTDNNKNTDKNTVTLMTVHSSKGLEFPFVFLVGMEEGLFPSIMSSNTLEELEEERRLFYVAMTRAEKRLFLSYSKIRFKWGQYIDADESRFISEINEKHTIRKSFLKTEEPSKHSFKISPKIKIKQNINKNNRRPVKKNNITNQSKSNLVKIDQYIVGQKVNHVKFGQGKIIHIEGEKFNKKATVSFNKFGEKHLLLSFAKLQIIR